MMTNQQVKRMTAGDVKLDDYFSAIDQGLGLWLATEKDQRPRENRYEALCAGSLQALTAALDVMRFFACRRKLVTVRVTTAMLADTPHGALRPSQVFYRWEARIGAEAPNPLYGAPKIGDLTFAVRPVMTRGERGERFVNVEVAVRRRKGGILETVEYDVDEVVSITHPLRPNNPGQLVAAAKQVVRLADREKPGLAMILKAAFKAFDVEITNLFLWFRRRRAASQRTYRLFLAYETGVEVVEFARVSGGGLALASGPPDDPGIDIEEQTPAQVGRAVYDDLVLSNEENHASSLQDLYDYLDSWPSEVHEGLLFDDSARLSERADRAIEAAASELADLGVVTLAWLGRAREEAQAATLETLFSDAGHEAALDLARRYLYAGSETTEIAGRLAMRADNVIVPSTAAHREAIIGMRQIVDSLPDFYCTPVLHAELGERVTIIERLLELYKRRFGPS